MKCPKCINGFNYWAVLTTSISVCQKCEGLGNLDGKTGKPKRVFRFGILQRIMPAIHDMRYITRIDHS